MMVVDGDIEQTRVMIRSYLGSDFKCNLNCRWSGGCMFSVTFVKRIRGKYEVSLRNMHTGDGDKPWWIRKDMCNDFEEPHDAELLWKCAEYVHNKLEEQSEETDFEWIKVITEMLGGDRYTAKAIVDNTIDNWLGSL